MFATPADSSRPPEPGTVPPLPEPASGAPVDPFPPQAQEERRRKEAEQEQLPEKPAKS